MDCCIWYSEEATGWVNCATAQSPPRCTKCSSPPINCIVDSESLYCCTQGDHLSGKPGNVREFNSCQGNVRDFAENQGIVREKNLSGKVA